MTLKFSIERVVFIGHILILKKICTDIYSQSISEKLTGTIYKTTKSTNAPYGNFACSACPYTLNRKQLQYVWTQLITHNRTQLWPELGWSGSDNVLAGPEFYDLQMERLMAGLNQLAKQPAISCWSTLCESTMRKRLILVSISSHVSGARGAIRGYIIITSVLRAALLPGHGTRHPFNRQPTANQ